VRPQCWRLHPTAPDQLLTAPDGRQSASSP
jgi:hypothetical protein